MLLRNAHAQVATTITDPLGTRFGSNATLAQFFGLIVNVLIGVGIALTIIFLVLGGIQYITSRGDAKAADAARSSLTNAVIGFVVVLAAVTIRFIVGNIIGADTGGFQDVSV
jgi:hypothetical protein